MTEITETFELKMLDFLKPAAAAMDMNGPAFYLFCIAAKENGKPVHELTLGEVSELVAVASKRYESMCNRSKTLEV